MIKWLRLIFIIISMVTFCITSSVWAANLVVNGDFEAGDTGFVSEFRSKDDPWLNTGNNRTNDTGIWGPGTYVVTTDPSIYHPDAASYGDHSSGRGNMMAVNGTTGGTIDLVWFQSVSSIDTSKNYWFSAWGSTWAALDKPGIFAVLINGISLGVVGNGSSALGVWEKSSFLWQPRPQDSVANIAILNTSTDFVGNDFALDDISLQAVPIPQTMWLFGTALLCLVGLKRKYIR